MDSLPPDDEAAPDGDGGDDRLPGAEDLDRLVADTYRELKERGFSERAARRASEGSRTKWLDRAYTLADAIKTVESYGVQVEPLERRPRRDEPRPPAMRGGRQEPANGKQADAGGRRADDAPVPAEAGGDRADILVKSALRGLRVIRQEAKGRRGPKPHQSHDLNDERRIRKAVDFYERREWLGESWYKIANDADVDPHKARRWVNWLEEEWRRDPERSGN